jgi:hypothetical protein
LAGRHLLPRRFGSGKTRTCSKRNATRAAMGAPLLSGGVRCVPIVWSRSMVSFARLLLATVQQKCPVRCTKTHGGAGALAFRLSRPAFALCLPGDDHATKVGGVSQSHGQASTQINGHCNLASMLLRQLFPSCVIVLLLCFLHESVRVSSSV